MKRIILAILLSPLTVLYRLVVACRNYGYNKGLMASYQFQIPLISVGNLSVGGTGKTPMVEYLIRLLDKRHQLAVLSRGYGRKTKGLLFAQQNNDAQQLGDEPYQLYRKYGDRVQVVVDEDRVSAIRAITERYANTSVILLDDAYQHRRVVPHYSILLTDFETPFYDDYLLPSGRLREARKEALRAHAVVVTKCPKELSGSEKTTIKNNISHYAKEVPVFFSYVKYGDPKPFWKSEPMCKKRVVLLSGIAKPCPFEEYLKTRFEVVKHFRFPDHYSYTVADLNRIKQYLGDRKHSVDLLTTEKDMVKLLHSKFSGIFSNFSCYYLPIEIAFIDPEQGDLFDQRVAGAVEDAAYVITGHAKK